MIPAPAKVAIFVPLRGYRLSPRVLGIVAGCSLGGFLVALLQGR